MPTITEYNTLRATSSVRSAMRDGYKEYRRDHRNRLVYLRCRVTVDGSITKISSAAHVLAQWILTKRNHRDDGDD